MAKVNHGDEVLVRGEIIWVEAAEGFRVKFPGYAYPIPVADEAIEQVFKRKQPRDKPD